MVIRGTLSEGDGLDVESGVINVTGVRFSDTEGVEIGALGVQLQDTSSIATIAIA